MADSGVSGLRKMNQQLWISSDSSLDWGSRSSLNSWSSEDPIDSSKIFICSPSTPRSSESPQGVSGLRRMNQMRRTYSDSSLDWGSDSSLNSWSSEEPIDSSKTSIGDPSTAKSSESPKSLLEQKEKTLVGLGIISSMDQEAPVQKNNNVVSQQIKVAVPNASGLDKPLASLSITNTIFENNVDVPKDKISITTGPIEFGSREIAHGGGIRKGLKLRHDWPCVFAHKSNPSSPPRVSSDLIVKPDTVADSECKGHAIINPEGNPCFRPLTFCSVHKCAGLLRLEEIENSESYTRVDFNFPISKVIHRFNYCVLEFPPTHDKLIVFKDNKKEAKDSPPPAVDKPGPSSRRLRHPQNKFFKNCLYCYGRLDIDDVFIYRGDSAFCSPECRYWNTREDHERDEMARADINAYLELEIMAEIMLERQRSTASSSNDKGKGILFKG